ncbi:flagellar type III secretion system pore protein FliP [Marinomonas algicola]|jgi:flagellar biosynthesis protein FliP|uniref:flagellar type III secretion system pore protein FliP n=1 Tax=Marinomonas algicola TaxID=2773454 RepID=UPI00174829FD|nr:flagellar type III secretion system pore protein FliP [Marinomonas algicola]
MLKGIVTVFLSLWSVYGLSESGLPAVTVVTNPDGSQDYSVSLQILFIMTALSLLPSALIMMSSFTRIIIVLSILRQAIGLQSTPSNQVLIGMALFLTLFIMTPTLDRINDQALQPYLNDQLASLDAVQAASVPIRDFMLAQTREDDIALFVKLAGKEGQIESLETLPFTILMPAFVTSELKTAFQIGFMIFIPFLIVDLVVASVLMAMGMMMLSPVIISLPFKIMLFVMVDGWSMIMGTLAASFGI